MVEMLQIELAVIERLDEKGNPKAIVVHYSWSGLTKSFSSREGCELAERNVFLTKLK